MLTGRYCSYLRAPIGLSLLLTFCLPWVTPVSKTEPFHGQSTNSSQQPTTSAPSSDPQQPQPQQVINPPVPKRAPIRFVLVRHTYQCAGGVQLVAIVQTDAIHITLNGDGKVYELKKAESPGANLKYSSGSIVWSSDVQTGALEDVSNVANPKILAKDCHLQSAFPPVSPANSISGTLNFAMPKQLPPNAVIRIELQDLTPQDELHKRVAVMNVGILGREPPIPFQLKFDPQTIRPKDCCALYAEIRVGDKPLFATTRPQPVPDIANPGPMKLELVPLKDAQP